VKNHILACAKRSILEGHKVEVVKTLKANGENCQIAWSLDANAWVVASKNVGLLARDADDLQLYTTKGIRYNFAILMARCWFDLTSKLSKKEYD
jgi:hypothetical protein